VRIQRGSERLSFQFIGAGQISERNLDGGEKFMLGGPAGVRAYPSGEASGDQGFKTSLDAKYALLTATKVGDIGATVFYDYGYIQQNKDSMGANMTTPNNYTLKGWGLGLETNASGKFNVKALWAKPIGDNPAASVTGNNSDGKPNESRWWLQGSVNF
jgi:hemolysin activation/secretion protein